MARHPTSHSAPDDLQATWLAAEGRGDETAADSALASLMASLPELAPSSGFAHRVLRGAGVLAERRDLFARRGVQWAIASSLVLAAIAWLVVPGLLHAVLAPFALSFSLAGALGGISQLFILAGRALGAGAVYWRIATEVGSACSLALSQPPVALLLLGLVMISAGAFRALNRLMSPERSPFHAH